MTNVCSATLQAAMANSLAHWHLPLSTPTCLMQRTGIVQRIAAISRHASRFGTTHAARLLALHRPALTSCMAAHEQAVCALLQAACVHTLWCCSPLCIAAEHASRHASCHSVICCLLQALSSRGRCPSAALLAMLYSSILSGASCAARQPAPLLVTLSMLFFSCSSPATDPLLLLDVACNAHKDAKLAGELAQSAETVVGHVCDAAAATQLCACRVEA